MHFPFFLLAMWNLCNCSYLHLWTLNLGVVPCSMISVKDRYLQCCDRWQGVTKEMQITSRTKDEGCSREITHPLSTHHASPSYIAIKIGAYAVFREEWNYKEIVNTMLRIKDSCVVKSWFKMHLWEIKVLSKGTWFSMQISPDLCPWHFQGCTHCLSLLLLECNVQET